MRIISTPLPAEASELVDGRAAIVMALDTLVDQKTLVVGLAEGVMQGPELAHVRVCAVGQLVIDRCSRHHALNHPNAPALVAGVAQVGNAVQRVRQVLAKAPPGTFVLLLCANAKAYDAAHAALNIQLQAACERLQ